MTKVVIDPLFKFILGGMLGAGLVSLSVEGIQARRRLPLVLYIVLQAATKNATNSIPLIRTEGGKAG